MTIYNIVVFFYPHKKSVSFTYILITLHFLRAFPPYWYLHMLNSCSIEFSQHVKVYPIGIIFMKHCVWWFEIVWVALESAQGGINLLTQLKVAYSLEQAPT